MYDPSIGRWLQEDPIGFDAGDVNLYCYVGNAPTVATDPSGLEIPIDLRRRREIETRDRALGIARRQWEQGRIESWSGFMEAFGVRVNAATRWFNPAEESELLRFFAQIRSRFPQIEADLASYGTRNPVNDIEHRVNRWFGNGAALERAQINMVRDRFRRVREGIDNNSTTFWDDSDSLSVYGQVNYWWTSNRYHTIQLGSKYFAGRPVEKIATIIHELTHLYGNTRDAGYYADVLLVNRQNPVAYEHPETGAAIALPTAQQVNNADSYAGFVTEFYI
jgi:hypothetical protein